MDDDESGAGAASLAGYEYQIDVSIWLALDLVLVSRLTEELILEPASQEDLEATLADTEPGRLVNSVPMAGYTLIVQAKRRSGDAWTPKSLKALLNHGGDNRVSAAARLKNGQARYLLVTSAGLNGDARKLNRRQVGSWPKAAVMPSVIAKGVTHDISGRVAIVANQDDERLRGDIDRLLSEGCRVPNARLEDCRNKLREEARTRIARAGGGRWQRSEIEAVIRLHEGYLASTPELEQYVHPNNWQDLRAIVNQKSAAIIIGQSGTGKTLATKMLYDELRKEIPGLARVPIRLGPSALRNDMTPSPVLYDIEDPWGRFDFDPDSRPWNDQLGNFLAAARSDRMVVATSRLDVAHASGALGTVKPWIVGLEAENYDRSSRQRIYRNRIETLPRDLQPLARASENKVLDELATPLEIQKFFDAMRTQDRHHLKNTSVYVTLAVSSAHQDAIEQTVVDQIEARKDIRAAAIIWALLVASDKVSRSVLREIDDHIEDIDTEMERGVSPLVDFFVASRNLRQTDGGIITYYHPRVEAGIVRTLKKFRPLVSRTLRRLIDLLVSPEGPSPEWGAGTAARMLARARSQFGVNPSQNAVVKIDAWLQARLTEAGKEFQGHLQLAAAAGSAASNGGELARYLLSRPDQQGGSYGFGNSWKNPNHTEEWYRARANDPSTRPIIETFVRTILPQDRIHYPDQLSDELARLSTGLSSAFLDAATQAVHYGYTSSDDAIVRGALADIEGFERIVDTAVKVLTPSAKELQEAAETNLDIVNDVHSEEYAQYLSENDTGYTASEFLRAYVDRVRKEKGWARIAQHRHADRLLGYWLQSISAEAEERPVTDEEFAGAFKEGYGTKYEDSLWTALRENWNSKYLPALETRLIEGSLHVHVDRAALVCCLEHEAGVLPAIIASLVENDAINRLITLGRGIVSLCRERRGDKAKHNVAANVALTQLPKTFREICEAELALVRQEAPVLSVDARGALVEVSNASNQVRLLRLELDASLQLATADDIRWALEEGDDSTIAVLAIEAAIRHEKTEVVEAALSHKFAHVVARALTAVAAPVAAPLSNRLLVLHVHRASPVRRALMEVLKAKPHPLHQATLIALAGDQWSKQGAHYGTDSDNYPIAHDAIATLAGLAPLGQEDDRALIKVATETSDAEVRTAIFDLLAKTGGFTMQESLFELATAPGGQNVRSSAAIALLRAAEQLDPRVIGKITPHLLATRYEPVACVLALLLGFLGDIAAVRAIAEELSTNRNRRVLLLLVVYVLKDRDRRLAEEIGAMLPAEHAAVAWALGNSQIKVTDKLIADLGDHAVSAAVLVYTKDRPDTPK